ncbi:hypothetical protein [Pseudoduganella sp. R-34]|uniref:hypothetical protein n=1 Tax=unclassified Pseudoduganella TaxID=2637179 RepID=UPI003CF40449
MSTVVSYFQARLGAAFSIAATPLTLTLPEVAPPANPAGWPRWQPCAIPRHI